MDTVGLTPEEISAALPKKVKAKTAKPKTKKPAAKKSKPKAKKAKPAKKAAKAAKKPKAAKKAGKTIERTERLDMRLSKAENAKINAKAKKLRRTRTSIVLEAIEKIK